MELDTRNPFAAWCFEEEKYGVPKKRGFINPIYGEDVYNKVAEPMTAEKYSERHSALESFFTNDENMLPTALKNKADGCNKFWQRSYPAEIFPDPDAPPQI